MYLSLFDPIKDFFYFLFFFHLLPLLQYEEKIKRSRFIISLGLPEDRYREQIRPTNLSIENRGVKHCTNT